MFYCFLKTSKLVDCTLDFYDVLYELLTLYSVLTDTLVVFSLITHSLYTPQSVYRFSCYNIVA